MQTSVRRRSLLYEANRLRKANPKLAELETLCALAVPRNSVHKGYEQNP